MHNELSADVALAPWIEEWMWTDFWEIDFSDLDEQITKQEVTDKKETTTEDIINSPKNKEEEIIESSIYHSDALEHTQQHYKPIVDVGDH